MRNMSPSTVAGIESIGRAREVFVPLALLRNLYSEPRDGLVRDVKSFG